MTYYKSREIRNNYFPEFPKTRGKYFPKNLFTDRGPFATVCTITKRLTEIVGIRVKMAPGRKVCVTFNHFQFIKY